MTATSDASAPREPTDAGTAPRRWTPARLVVLAIVVGLVVMWGYALFVYPATNPNQPGELADEVFAAAAETRCAQAATVIAALPPAYETPTPDERADAVDAATDEYQRMLDDLAAIAPTDPDDRAKVDEWLADWGTYVANRRDYAERLRVDPDARLYVTENENDGTQITRSIDHFATINEMASCVTPGDIS
ncbi:MAG: hypothetical protein MUF83_12280 [Acidimicrobiales bacterium]|nr:hypothetical protein [Acidimicrobiales bacterium]